MHEGQLEYQVFNRFIKPELTKRNEGYFLNTGGIIMSSLGNLILAIMWILVSPLWFFIENTAVGTIWLCGGIVELIIGLIRRNKEKKGK